MSCKESDCQCQVVATAFLPDIGWAEVDGDICSRRLKTDVRNSSTNAVITLLDGNISQPRQVEHHSPGHIHFNGHRRGFQAHDLGTIRLY